MDFEKLSSNCYHKDNEHNDCMWRKDDCKKDNCPVMGVIDKIESGEFSVWLKPKDKYQDIFKVYEVRETVSFVSQFPLDE